METARESRGSSTRAARYYQRGSKGAARGWLSFVPDLARERVWRARQRANIRPRAYDPRANVDPGMWETYSSLLQPRCSRFAVLPPWAPAHPVPHTDATPTKRDIQWFGNCNPFCVFPTTRMKQRAYPEPCEGLLVLCSCVLGWSSSHLNSHSLLPLILVRETTSRGFFSPRKKARARSGS